MYPVTLAKKYPNAGKTQVWHWVLLLVRRWRNKKTDEQGRHHIDPSVIQRTLHEAVLKSGIPKTINTPDAKHQDVVLTRWLQSVFIPFITVQEASEV